MTNLNRNEVVVEIEGILNQIKPSQRTKWCIYRATNDIRELNKDAYTPQMVSIGPFHHGNERLQDMQTTKWEYFKKFADRTQTNLDDLVSFIENLEPSVRLCYAENIVLDKKELVKIIALDACFIIELFLTSCYFEWDVDDAILPGNKLSTLIRVDLLLLENQLLSLFLKRYSIGHSPPMNLVGSFHFSKSHSTISSFSTYKS